MAGHVTHRDAATGAQDVADGVTTIETIGDERTGHLSQRIRRIAPGSSLEGLVTHGSEEILYVTSGHGTLELAGASFTLEPDVGIHLAAGESYTLRAPEEAQLEVVSVLAPIPADSDVPLGERQVTVRLADQPSHPAGKDREFRFVVTPDSGCRGVTQFVGWIPPGRARDHYHFYDEVVYILEGTGVLHREGEPDVAICQGSCIHFPARMVHCVENVGDSRLRVLGVFHPPGSAAAAYHPDDE
ncbi:MAG: cupin domain-containing protein [Gaiellales bacterium]